VNATLIQQKFFVHASNWRKAVKALYAWSVKYTEAPLEPKFIKDIDKFGEANLEEMFNVLGYDVVLDMDGNIEALQQHNFESATADHAIAFGFLKDTVEPGSYLLFHTDNDQLMRWRWGTDGLYHVERGGMAVFGESDSLILEIRATLTSTKVALSDLKAAATNGYDKTLVKKINQLLAELRVPTPP
jgi:hypothetical protein